MTSEHLSLPPSVVGPGSSTGANELPSTAASLSRLEQRRAYYREYNRRWRAKNPEKARAIQRRWRLAHPDKVRALHFTPQAIAQRKEYARKHPELIKSICKRSREKNKDRFVRTLKNWRQRNKERIAVRDRQRRESNPQLWRENFRRWQRNNPEKARERNARYRAKRRQCAISPESVASFLLRIQKKRYVSCYYCRKRIAAKNIHADHVIAISSGGEHSVSNICVTCAFCNLSKGPKELGRWQPRVPQMVLSL